MKIIRVIAVIIVSLLAVVLYVRITLNDQDEIDHHTHAELGYSYTFENVEVNGKTYFELNDKAFNGDSNALRQLSLVQVPDSLTIPHSSSLIFNVYRVGEKRYLEIIKDINPLQRKYIYGILKLGMNDSHNKEYRQKLPILDSLIHENVISK